jgi:hypothetical protein
MRYRLALDAQTLSAAVDGLASPEITHGCQAWPSWAPLGEQAGRRPARTRDSMARGKAQGTGGDHATACSPQPASRQDSPGSNTCRHRLRSVADGRRTGPVSRIPDNNLQPHWPIRGGLVDPLPEGVLPRAGLAFSRRKLHPVCATPGVGFQEKYFPRFAIWKRRRGVDESDWEAASMSVNYRGRRAAAVPGNPVRCWAAHETFPRTRWLT